LAFRNSGTKGIFVWRALLGVTASDLKTVMMIPDDTESAEPAERFRFLALFNQHEDSRIG